MILELFSALALLFSGSAAWRVSSAKERIEGAAREYDKIMLDLEESKGKMERTIEHIGRNVIRSIKSLRDREPCFAPPEARPERLQMFEMLLNSNRW